MPKRTEVCSQHVASVQATATSVAARIAALPDIVESTRASMLIQAMGELEQARKFMGQAMDTLARID